MRKPILNLHSMKPQPPRIFDVIVDKGSVNLEVKIKDAYEVIPWEDVVYQVKAAQEMAERELV